MNTNSSPIPNTLHYFACIFPEFSRAFVRASFYA
jgi:hypothetical protein